MECLDLNAYLRRSSIAHNTVLKMTFIQCLSVMMHKTESAVMPNMLPLPNMERFQSIQCIHMLLACSSVNCHVSLLLWLMSCLTC
jgi:hypothetical protein